MAVIFDAQKEYNSLEKTLKSCLETFSKKICLASVAISQDYSTQVYRASQAKVAKELGIEYRPIDLDENISYDNFKVEVEKLNKDNSITGIILNKPFSNGWDEEEIFSLLDERKDVEGVHPTNLGKLFMGNMVIADTISQDVSSILISPTVRSILCALNSSGEGTIDLYGRRVVIVGFSSIIGKPLALLLGNSLATVTIAQIGTSEKGDLAEYVSSADIVISAVGKPELIKGEWIKDGAIVIDVGTGKKGDKQTGDVEFDEASKKASFITSVPGGVGKLTTMYLYWNLIIATRFKI